MNPISFLLKAKGKTYADGGGKAVQLDDGCKELVYQEGGLTYRDRYYGFDPFAGEEVLIQENKIMWAMNYFGGIVDAGAEGGDVYLFLQEAMRQVGADRPYRGPERFERGDFVYVDASQGTPERFQGEEKIYFKGKTVYSLVYHGGRVG